MEEHEWDAVIEVHLKGHFAPTRHAAAHWRERSKAGEEVRGRVINTSSPSGVFGNVGQANYGAAKAGIVGFTLIAAQELARYGVTVNALAPNARTRMTEAAFGEIPPPDDGFDPADPANNSPIVVALCADEAQHITGQVFFVYGGVVNMLRGWEAGELFASEQRWDPDALLHELQARLPDGAAPAGMLELDAPRRRRARCASGEGRAQPRAARRGDLERRGDYRRASGSRATWHSLGELYERGAPPRARRSSRATGSW